MLHACARGCLCLLMIVLTACGGGASDTNGNLPSAWVEVAGQVTFARVPFNSSNIGLNYAAEYAAAVRWADVEALDDQGVLLARARTDSRGDYRLEVPANRLFRIEVLAQSVESQANLRWNVQVRNNRAAGDPVYRLTSGQLNSGSTDLIVDLHAQSGWGGAAYNGSRSAAPFAILDSLSTIHHKLTEANVALNLLSLDLHWSPANDDTSFYDVGGNFIEIMGDENADTDEYDQHVIVHEWRHFFEAQISRGDVIGGSHSGSVALELRTAFSEGAANAWAAFILDDPIYKDSAGAGQQFGFAMDVENQTFGNPGWFSQLSVQQIVYDMLDSTNEPGDNLVMGLDEIVQLWMDPRYREKTSLTGIHALEAAVAEVLPRYSDQVRTLVGSMQIQGQGYFAENESGRPAGVDYALPIYHQLRPDQPALEVCSDNSLGEYNRVQNRQLVRLEVPGDGSFVLRMRYSAAITASQSGQSLNQASSLASDPDFALYSRGRRLSGESLSGTAFGESLAAGEEVGRIDLSAGVYVVDLYEFNNIDRDLGSGGLRCFTFSVTSQ